MPRLSRVLCAAGLFVFALGLAGCDGSSAGSTSGFSASNDGSSAGSTSGLSASKKLVDLTDQEKGQFCDWATGKFGGYGNTCNSDWAFMVYPDQASCVEDASSPTNTPNCQATVQQAEACVNSIPKCANFEELKSSPQCATMTVC